MDPNDAGGVSGSYGVASGILNCVWMLAIVGRRATGGGERDAERALSWLLVRSGLRGGSTGGFVAGMDCLCG